MRLIDADALIDMLYREKRNALAQDFNSIARGVQASINCASNAPTIETKRGEWKWTQGGMCSECGFHNSNFDYNFCPNCGALMGERESE